MNTTLLIASLVGAALFVYFIANSSKPQNKIIGYGPRSEITKRLPQRIPEKYTWEHGKGTKTIVHLDQDYGHTNNRNGITFFYDMHRGVLMRTAAGTRQVRAKDGTVTRLETATIQEFPNAHYTTLALSDGRVKQLAQGVAKGGLDTKTILLIAGGIIAAIIVFMVL